MPVWWERVRRLNFGHVHVHAALPDLRMLPSARVRVKGTQFLVHDPERRRSGDRIYVLRREPRNRRDPSAIAVYAGGRNVGYVSSVRASLMAPLLDRLGGAAVVNGLGAEVDSIRLWVDLPTVEALRAFVHAEELSAEGAAQA
jgi:hypothetical protein